MEAIKALILGIVQGLTEFLPVSSTAHLRIVPAVLGWEDPGAAFTAVIQLGTMAAVVIFFAGDLLRIATAWLASLRDPARRADTDARLGWFIIIGSIPIAVFGFVFKDHIETGARDLTLIACALILMGLVLGRAEAVGKRERDLRTLTRRDGIVIGLAQAAALVPGVSRSGATISAGLFLGLDRVSAARYSFLLSVPAIVGSGLFELKGIVDGTAQGPQPGALEVILSVGAAFVVGYASIAFLLRFLSTNSTRVFVIYRLALGALVLLLVAANLIS